MPKTLATPLELTQNVRDISVTERNGFKTCRRQWHLGTILNLEPRGVRNWAFDFGTGAHSGLEAYYKAVGGLIDNDDPLDAAITAFEQWADELEVIIKEAKLGDLQSVVLNELLEYKELGYGMLDNYDKFAGIEDNFVVCAVEGEWTEKGKKLLKELKTPYALEVHPVLHDSGRVLVPIVDPDTSKWIENNPYLSSRLDLIIYSMKTGTKGFWIWDHKTSASSPSDRGVEMDDQATGYSYTFWRNTGVIPRGTVFNYLIKQLPKPPRLIREDTDLSSAKDQLTTAPQYRDALVEFGYMKNGKIDSSKHAECYQALLAHGWGRFFKRLPTQRNTHELMAFERRLVDEYADMLEAYQNPEHKTYPHRSQYVCPGCPVLPICQAMEDGSDVQFIVEERYQQAPDRKAA